MSLNVTVSLQLKLTNEYMSLLHKFHHTLSKVSSHQPACVQMARTQKNKATAHHLGLLKARLAKLRRELITPKGGGGGAAGEGAITFFKTCTHNQLHEALRLTEISNNQ